MDNRAFRYRWFSAGDINGFFGLMFDNLTVLSFLAGILVFAFGYPADIVYGKMFPGTALGVLFGDAVYTWMAFRLARRKQSNSVTAMPLGLDTPSTIGIALTVLGPAFLYLKQQGMQPREAAILTWYIGMATMVLIGCIKLVFSFIGGWVQKIVPQAGLLGSLAGIGLALIGFIPLLDIFGLPVVGMAALGLVLYSLVAEIKLPMRIPGVLASVVLGTAVYYALAPFGVFGTAFTPPTPEFHAALPMPSLGFIDGMWRALQYLPIAFPFALLTIVGGINVTESAKVAGDEYSTRSILLTEALSTLVAGLFGGVAQTTPYIGQPAYKAMGSRAGYTLLTGIFIGLGGMLGYISFFVELIPRAVLAPILIFVALDIISQAFRAVPQRHIPAVAFSLFPNVARMVQIKLSNPELVPAELFNKAMVAVGKTLPELMVTVALGNGFILTAMLWGGFIASMIDRRLRATAAYLFICSGLTFFGIIHSVIPDGRMYLPWLLPANMSVVPYQFSLAYAVLGGMLLLFSFTKESREPSEEGHHG